MFNQGLVATESSPVNPVKVTDKLLAEKKNLELRLEAVNKLIDQLEASPETQQIIDGLAELGAFGHHY